MRPRRKFLNDLKSKTKIVIDPDFTANADRVGRAQAMIQTRKLAIACPQCGSGGVFYSCTPNCCYNHVCADCGTTFEPATTLKGGTVTAVVPPDPLPDATDPTAECARCTSNAVYMTEDGGIVCGKCGALLTLELTEIAPG